MSDATELPADPRDDARQLLARMVSDIRQQLASAPPAERTKLIVKFLPILSKQIDDEKVDDGLTKMRAELDGYRDELGRALLGRYADMLNDEEYDMLNDEEYDALGDIEQPAPPEDAT